MLMVRTISSAPVGPIPQDHGSPSLHSRLHYSEGSHFWILKIKYPHDHKLPVPLSHPYYILIDLWNFCPLITLLPPHQMPLDLASCSIQSAYGPYQMGSELHDLIILPVPTTKKISNFWSTQLSTLSVPYLGQQMWLEKTHRLCIFKMPWRPGFQPCATSKLLPYLELSSSYTAASSSLSLCIVLFTIKNAQLFPCLLSAFPNGI